MRLSTCVNPHPHPHPHPPNTPTYSHTPTDTTTRGIHSWHDPKSTLHASESESQKETLHTLLEFELDLVVDDLRLQPGLEPRPLHAANESEWDGLSVGEERDMYACVEHLYLEYCRCFLLCLTQLMCTPFHTQLQVNILNEVYRVCLSTQKRSLQ